MPGAPSEEPPVITVLSAAAFALFVAYSLFTPHLPAPPRWRTNPLEGEPMSKNPVNDIAPYPRREADATADALARNLTVVAQLNWRRMLDTETGEDTRAATNLLVNLYGIVKVLKALQAVAPETADEVARDLWADWHDGGAVGEWLHAWLVGFGIDPARVDAVAGEMAREAA